MEKIINIIIQRIAASTLVLDKMKQSKIPAIDPNVPGAKGIFPIKQPVAINKTAFSLKFMACVYNPSLYLSRYYNRFWILDVRYWIWIPVVCCWSFWFEELPDMWDLKLQEKHSSNEAFLSTFLTSALSLLPSSLSFCISCNSIIHLSYGNILFNGDLSANFVFRNYPNTAV